MPKINAIEIYNSVHLKISFDKKLLIFIQEWNHNKEMSIDDFQTELLAFKELVCIHRPKNVIWLQENFTTKLSNEDQMWIEINVNKQCSECGLKKCAFVIGKDLIAQMQVFKFFEESESCLSPRHFADIDEALSWIFENKEPSRIELNNFDIQFKGKTPEGKSLYTIETSSTNTESVLKSFNHVLKENTFLKLNAQRFYSLTPREKQIFQLYANGVGIKKISEELFLSELTIRTHWRNVKKKLNIKSHSDIADYKNSFYL